MLFLWGIITGLFLASPIILLFKYLDYRKGNLMSNKEPVPTYGHENMHYRSGYQAGIEDEHNRTLALLNSKRDTGSHDAENDFINAFIDDLTVLIERGN